MMESAEPATAPAAPDERAASPAPRRVLAGTLEVVGAAACFSAIPIFTVLATDRGGASLESVLGGRYLLAALALLAMARRAVWRPIPAGARWRLLVFGGLGQAAVAYLALSALRFLPAATMVFLFYTFPVWVAVIGAVRGTERLTPRRLLALALALGGIWALVGSPWAGALHPAGIALTLAAALVYAAYIPLLESLQRRTGTVVASLWVSVGAAAVFLVAGGAVGRLTTIDTAMAWIGTVGLALISTVLAFLLFLRGLSLLGPVRTAIASTAEPFFVAILGAVVLAQPTSRATILGGALVAAAVVLMAIARETPQIPERPV
ncbi:MAG TPA: DMT family transporter [Gemmatimonadaceae bacterium]|nr:DMT family transporter [Gemmatimonadaceae bacterium]